MSHCLNALQMEWKVENNYECHLYCDVMRKRQNELTNLHLVLHYRCPSIVDFFRALIFVLIRPIHQPWIVSSFHVHRYCDQRLQRLRLHFFQLVPIELLRHRDAVIRWKFPKKCFITSNAFVQFGKTNISGKLLDNIFVGNFFQCQKKTT